MSEPVLRGAGIAQAQRVKVRVKVDATRVTRHSPVRRRRRSRTCRIHALPVCWLTICQTTHSQLQLTSYIMLLITTFVTDTLLRHIRDTFSLHLLRQTVC